MAECGNARCNFEKRTIKRELQRWSKNLIHLVGLENVISELFGRRKWRKIQKSIYGPKHISDCSFETTEDWEPDDVCPFCNEIKTLTSESCGGVSLSDDCQDGLQNISDDGNEPVKISQILQRDTPLYYMVPWYIASTTPSLEKTELDHRGQMESDQPLDLRVNGYDKEDTQETFLRVPNIINNGAENSLPNGVTNSKVKKVRDCSGKRGYTEEELQAALKDIQTGKLGTRRAAVIYGIPRSTLRNKVYKLSHQNEPKVEIKQPQELGDDPEMDNNVKEQAGPQCKIKHNKYESETLRQILKNKLKKKQNYEEEVSIGLAKSDPSCVDNYDGEDSFSTILKTFLSSLPKLALNSSSNLPSYNKLVSELNSISVLPKVIRKLVEERFEEERAKLGKEYDFKMHEEEEEEDLNANLCLTIPSATHNQKSNGDNDHSISNVILKVPSYKFMCKGSVASKEGRGLVMGYKRNVIPYIPSAVNSSLDSKSVITSNGICNNDPEPLKSDSMVLSESSCLRDLITKSITPKDGVTDSESSEQCPQSKRVRDNNFSRNMGNHHSKQDSSKDGCVSIGKGSRPKRGKYRNYDRDNLARAVQAVQNGEMSVHRAGSYYGVPHSTLEYKVKERHLLRPRKRPFRSSQGSSDSQTNKADSDEPFSKCKTEHSKEEELSIPTTSTADVNDISSPISSPNKTNEGSVKLSTSSPESVATEERKINDFLFPYNFPSYPYNPSTFGLWPPSTYLPYEVSSLSSNPYMASQFIQHLQEDFLLHAKTGSDPSNIDLTKHLETFYASLGLKGLDLSALNRDMSVVSESDSGCNEPKKTADKLKSPCQSLMNTDINNSYQEDLKAAIKAMEGDEEDKSRDDGKRTRIC